MELLNNPEQPLFNRPLMATYPPGSTFKLVNELVALQTGGRFAPNRLSRATGSWCAAPTATSTRATWALPSSNSCNPYFYQVMRATVLRGRSTNRFEDARLGLGEWRRRVMEFGLGEKLGVDMGQEKKA